MKALLGMGKPCESDHQTKASSHTNATSDAPAIAIGAHWSRRARVITTKHLTQ